LKEQNDALKAQQASIASCMSKEKVISALNKKAQYAEDLAKATEKSYLKDGVDVKTFSKNFIKQRSEYH